MAVTDSSFIRVDANDANDLPLKAGHSHTFTPFPLTVTVPEKPDDVIGLARYTESWTFPEAATGEVVELTQAQFVALMAAAKTPISKAATYPQLHLINSDTPTWLVYSVSLAVSDGGQKGNNIDRFCTVTCTHRSISGSLTFVVDNGGGNSVTVDLVSLEAVGQLITVSGKNTTTEGNDSLSARGPSPISCVVMGYVATGDLDKLQKTLKAKLAVEMVGDAFDTTGSGYFSTELTAGTTGVLEDLRMLGIMGAKALVQLSIVRDTTP